MTRQFAAMIFFRILKFIANEGSCLCLLQHFFILLYFANPLPPGWFLTTQGCFEMTRVWLSFYFPRRILPWKRFLKITYSVLLLIILLTRLTRIDELGLDIRIQMIICNLSTFCSVTYISSFHVLNLFSSICLTFWGYI